MFILRLLQARQFAAFSLICRRKTVQLHTDGTPSVRASVSALWGSKAGETVVELDLAFEVETEKSVLRRQGLAATDQ